MPRSFFIFSHEVQIEKLTAFWPYPLGALPSGGRTNKLKFVVRKKSNQPQLKISHPWTSQDCDVHSAKFSWHYGCKKQAPYQTKNFHSEQIAWRAIHSSQKFSLKGAKSLTSQPSKLFVSLRSIAKICWMGHSVFHKRSETLKSKLFAYANAPFRKFVFLVSSLLFKRPSCVVVITFLFYTFYYRK